MIDNIRFVQKNEIVKCAMCGEKVTSGHLVNEFSPDASLSIKYYCVDCLNERARAHPEDFKNYAWKRNE